MNVNDKIEKNEKNARLEYESPTVEVYKFSANGLLMISEGPGNGTDHEPGDTPGGSW